MQGRCEGSGNVFGNTAGIVNSLYTFGQAFGCRAKKSAEIHFLKRLPIPRVAGYIAHQQHHGGGILKRGVQANRGIGCAWTPGHQAHTRPAR